MINRVEIKMDAKVLVRTARVSPIVMTAIVMAICFVLDRVVDLVEGGSLFYTYTLNWDYLQASLQGDIYAMDMLLNNLPASTASSFFFSTLVSLFTVVLNGGYYVYCIGIRRGAEMPYATLLDGLSVAGKLIWCWLQITVKIFLWSMLFVIPGIIAAYRYRFAYYNDYGPAECVADPLYDAVRSGLLRGRAAPPGRVAVQGAVSKGAQASHERACRCGVPAVFLA